MASNQQQVSEVSVHYRHVELQSGVELRETDDGGLFLALAEPPPVRTVLELRDARGGSAYEITAVIEVESAGVSRGCRVRRIDDAALQSRPVGSERLADASGGPSSGTGAMPAARPRSDDGEERWSDDYGAQMAVPAPVVDPDASDDTGETSASFSGGGSGGSGGDDEDASDEGGDDDTSATSTDSGNAGESPRQGKKRRGRKRK